MNHYMRFAELVVKQISLFNIYLVLTSVHLFFIFSCYNILHSTKLVWYEDTHVVWRYSYDMTITMWYEATRVVWRYSCGVPAHCENPAYEQPYCHVTILLHDSNKLWKSSLQPYCAKKSGFFPKLVMS